MCLNEVKSKMEDLPCYYEMNPKFTLVLDNHGYIQAISETMTSSEIDLIKGFFGFVGVIANKSQIIALTDEKIKDYSDFPE